VATSTTTRPSSSTRSRTSPVFSALIGLAALAVLLQGLWAGLFFAHHGKAADSWIEVHARGADVGILLGILATGFALWKLRSRRDLWVGSGLFTLVMILEAYIGGLIRDAGKDTLIAVHVPLAMALMGLAVWLPLRARRH